MRAITIWHEALQLEANVWRQWYKRSPIIGAVGLSLPEYLLLAPNPSWHRTYWSCTLAHTLFHTEPAIKIQSVVPVQLLGSGSAAQTPIRAQTAFEASMAQHRALAAGAFARAHVQSRTRTSQSLI